MIQKGSYKRLALRGILSQYNYEISQDRKNDFRLENYSQS